MQSQSLLHIRVIEGEGAIHGMNSRTSRGVVVEITDETGRPVDGAAVSFRMPEEGPGGTFERGMRTEIRTTTPDGLASIRTFQTGSQIGPFQIRVTVIRSGIRAGTVVSQYVSESAPRGKHIAPAGNHSGSKKWLIITAVAAAAATGAFTSGLRKSGSLASSTPAPPAPPQIGTPSVTIGGPQ